MRISGTIIKNQMPKRKTSNVWTFFSRDKEKKLAKCCNCKKEYRTSGNTSNLLDHLKRYHPECLNTNETDSLALDSEDTNLSRPSSSLGRSISPYFKRQNIYDSENHRKKEIDKALIKMVALDFQPFSLVEDKGFREFVQLLDSRYVLPSKTTLRDKLLKESYSKCQHKLSCILEQVNFVNLTCDLWSSRANQSFLTVTCHFVDNDFNVRCAVLSTNILNTNHTADNIAAEIKHIMSNWNIEEKVACIVTDNASSMIKACQILKIRHHPCFAHTINLVVQDALKCKEIQNVLIKCKELVTYFKSSNLASQQLILDQESKNKTPLKLIQEVPTRWNSALNMVKRILTINDSITIALSKMPKAPSGISLEDTMVMADMVSILNIFDEATNKISGNYVTMSLIIPLVFGIYSNISSYEPKTLEGNILHTCIINGIKARLFPYEERSLPRLATILDPRMKKEGFRSQENAKAAVLLLQNEMSMHNVKTINNNNTAENETETEMLTSTIPGGVQPTTSSNIFGFMKQRIADKNRQRTGNVDDIIILRQYLERTNANSETDPLLFWKVNDSEFVSLQKCAKKILSAPATSVPSERIFSKTGQLISDRRSRIKPKNVDMLIFINQNNWLEI